MEDAPKLLKIPKSECPDIWIRPPRHKWPKSWSSMEDPILFFEWNLFGHPFPRLLCEGWSRKLCWNTDVKVANSECLFANWRKGLFMFVYVSDGKHWTYTWDVLNVSVRPVRHCWKIQNLILKLGFLVQQHENIRVENLTCKRSRRPTTWKDLQGNACKVIANGPTKQRSSCTKDPLFVLMSSIWRKKNWRQWENCHTFSHKFLKW